MLLTTACQQQRESTDIYLAMSKTVRFFEIIQLLRAANKPLLARDMADALEVSVRTIYRDIATLQGLRTPIIGEPGIGYVMQHGYDLPPLNFNAEEAEAITVGLSMIARTGDAGLWKAAETAMRKLNPATSESKHLLTSSYGTAESVGADPGMMRPAIRAEQKILIDYTDKKDNVTTRVIWPLVLIYYSDSTMLVGWCELREAIRHFRLDRMTSSRLHDEGFTGQGAALREEWERTMKAATVGVKESDVF
ncbi:MAG: YafY family protein [Granulosicoccaceae bacterium]